MQNRFHLEFDWLEEAILVVAILSLVVIAGMIGGAFLAMLP